MLRRAVRRRRCKAMSRTCGMTLVSRWVRCLSLSHLVIASTSYLETWTRADSRNCTSIANIYTTRNMFLSNPTQLTAAALNHQYGAWKLDSDNTQETLSVFEQGIVNDQWPRQLGIAFQTLRWPVLPQGYGVGDIRALNPSFGQHQLYAGIPDSATVFPVSKVDATGAPATRSTYVLTRQVAGAINVDANRVIDPTLLKEFYTETGYSPYDLTTLAEFRNPAKPGCEDWNFEPCTPNGNSIYLSKGFNDKNIYMYTLPKDW
jgi:hypothetical protein